MIVPQVKYKSYDFSVDNFWVSSQFRVLRPKKSKKNTWLLRLGIKKKMIMNDK